MPNFKIIEVTDKNRKQWLSWKEDAIPAEWYNEDGTVTIPASVNQPCHCRCMRPHRMTFMNDRKGRLRAIVHDEGLDG